jgi:hypothetical protein
MYHELQAETGCEMLSGFNWLRQSQMEFFCEVGNETSDSVVAVNLLISLSHVTLDIRDFLSIRYVKV